MNKVVYRTLIGSHRWWIHPCRFWIWWPWLTMKDEGQFFGTDLLNNARTFWPRTTKFDSNTRGGAYFWGSATTLPQWGRAPELPNFQGSLLFIHTPFDAENTKFDVVTEVWFWRSVTPHPKGRVPSAPQFFGVPFYLWVHPLTQHYQNWRDSTYGDELVFTG